MKRTGLRCIPLMLAFAAGHTLAADNTLRLLTWADYAPKDVIEQFKKETGITVEVTLSNNEEMISKLRATGGSGYDLVQPSQDRIVSAQKEFRIYKPLDLSKVDRKLFIPSMLSATEKITTFDGKVYGLPYVWGTDGLVVNTKAAQIADYTDLCNPAYAGKVSMRLKRPTLMAFAFALGENPFKLYSNPQQYGSLMNKVGDKLIACKKNVKYFFENKEQMLGDLRNGALVGAMMWDSGGWKLNSENPTLKFVAPKSGAMGWVDTYALPARGKNDTAAYKWINFTMRPEIAAKIAKSVGNFSASQGADKLADPKLKAQFAASFPPAVMQKINWYPAVPAGLEEIEGRVLDRVKAAS
ncbi:extracellular solute-binding protein [Crenobacter sp. SG2303]|uniref:Extracellular solute-binding protein n=1 Tax=Crenobacter oryzisoli TaxID=3056844 RepID=A0ABT7XQK8_9NEIS|nr:extracellular solute-binding protein [Crenobacter sp. SG2303]MDN0076065.1 extracellular solute-binding protein [Crenobacter sp. SG2303]